MKQKKQVILTVLIAGMIFLFPPVLCAGPSVNVIQPKYEFEPVPEGAHVAHSFVIRNTGDAPLHIQKVNTG